ncbi:MAG: hypothetical protein AABX50_00740 [Nanoarchaeota archaeon]
MGENDGGAIRLISVSFFEPRYLEEDVIYVHLMSYGSEIGARAFSAVDFRYDGDLVEGNTLKDKGRKASNMTHSGREGFAICVPNHQEFIRRLESENNGRTGYSLLKDCVELSKRLQEIRGLTGIVTDR